MYAATTTQDDRTWGTIAHLSQLLGLATGIGFWLGPIVVWLVYRDRSRFVVQQAKEALNFQITCFLAGLVSGLLTFVGIGYLMLMALAVGVIVMPIVAAYNTSEGRAYRYPLTLRFID